PIDDRPRTEILEQLVGEQLSADGIWAESAEARERCMIAGWGAIALLVLYGSNHRNVHAVLKYFKGRFPKGKRWRFDDAKMAVCYGQTLYSFLRRYPEQSWFASSLIPFAGAAHSS